ncbi:MAG: response regulator [Planctomycetes bacterium]|nr:response regulator [Planctomycetota bacterium]
MGIEGSLEWPGADDGGLDPESQARIRKHFAPLGRVLTLDDEPDIRSLIRRFLETAAYEVLEAERAEEALSRVASERVDAILLDFSLPGISGDEFLGRLRTVPLLRASLPVLGVTACGDEALIVQRMRLGLRDFLVKPFSRRQLVEKVDTVLGVNRLALLGAIAGTGQKGPA